MVATILRRRKLGMGSAKGLIASSEFGMNVVRSDKMDRFDWSGTGYVIRWGTTASLPPEVRHLPIINSAEAIHRVNDKAGFRRLVQDHDATLVPKTWFDILNLMRFDTVERSYQLHSEGPWILRTKNHAQGKNLFYFEDFQDMNDKIQDRIFDNGYYISEFIQKEAEYRVYIVSGRVACLARKEVEDTSQIAWNRARTGCEFKNVRWGEWPLEVCRVACEAFKLSGLDFGGVDVMVDSSGRAYVIEINSACSLPLLEDGSVSYRQKTMAKCLDYLLTNGQDTLDFQTTEGWRGYVHPSLLADHPALIENEEE